MVLEFVSYEKKFSVMQCIGLVVEKEKGRNEEVSGVSRNYYVKKINRFGIKQKRIVWFEFKDSSFHISKLEKKDHQNFSIRFIKKFIKKLNTCQLDIEFYKEAKYKNLNLVFSNEAEMEEFLEIAQKLQGSLRESKFQVKHSVIFAQDVAGLKRKRRSSWLSLQNSQEASLMNREDLFNYNVVVSGRVSHEKRYLVLDIDSAQVFLFSRERKLLKKFDIENLAVRFYMNEPSKLELLCPKGNLDLVFPSVYTKYHFASSIILHNNPGKVIKTDHVVKNRAKVFTLTWNIGQKAEPSHSTLSLLLSKAESFDIITLGFQECGKINIWLRELSNYLEGKGFCLISYISMWDMFIVSYSRAQLLPLISEIKTCKKPTGIANLIGNKGGVLISFRFEDSSYCFLSCHLAARHNRLQLRNQNTRDLLTMRPSDPNVEFAVEFDFVFWLGDLNYRIDENFYEAIRLIDSGQSAELHGKDQLWLQMQSNKNLATFREPAKHFKPTYRCSRTSQEWSNKREQTPSWTDRILFKAHCDLKVEFYEALSECYGSDHRPVVAGFDTEYKVWFVMKELAMESQETLLGVIEVPSMEVEYFEESLARHAMASFHSAFIEGSPKSSQVELVDGKAARFDCKTLPMLTFVLTNPNALKELRVVLALWLVLNEGEVTVCGNSSMALKDVVEFVAGLDLFDCTKKFETNATTKFEFDLEFGSRVVGRVRGNWTFNVCRKSDQVRFRDLTEF